MGGKVKIDHGDGEILIHASGSRYADYDTLCGVDDDDAGIGTSIVSRTPKGKIDCNACWDLFKTCKEYRASNFTQG